MKVAKIPADAIRSCRDLAHNLKKTVRTCEDRLRAAFVYRCYMRALVPATSRLRTLRWRRFIGALDAFLHTARVRDVHAAAALHSIVAENADLLMPIPHGFGDTAPKPDDRRKNVLRERIIV
jgi:hypothetical protein